MKCPSCRASQLVEIEVTVGERELIMRSCSNCELRWWDSEGESVAFGTVLDLATPRRP